MNNYNTEYNGEKSSSNEYLPLSFLLNQLKKVIDYSFSESFWVRSEISNVKNQKQSGHYYFELIERDQDGKPAAKMSATCWKATASKVIKNLEEKIGKEIENGMICDFYMKVTYSPIYGLSANITNIRTAFTLGEHEKKKIKIREEIAKLGIENNQICLNTPKVITSIALLSPSAAAGLGDFVSEAKKWVNNKLVKIHPYVALFEGENSEQDICSAFNKINKENEEFKKENGNNKFDLIIILRGGGAKSSLAFLDELSILKSMLAQNIPVWSAIGHEEDSVLLDEYSCKSFHTPSKAAGEIWSVLKRESDSFTSNFNSISRLIETKTQKLLADLESKRNIIQLSAKNKVTGIENKLLYMEKNLMLQDPMAILSKGYAVLFDKEKKLIKSEEGFLNNDVITIQTHYGIFELNVNNIKKLEK